MEEKIEFVYVYDRIKRTIHKCPVTPESPDVPANMSWYIFTYEGEKCAYDNHSGRSPLQWLDKSFEYIEYTIVVSKYRNLINALYVSDTDVFQEISRAYLEDIHDSFDKRCEIDSETEFKVIGE